MTPTAACLEGSCGGCPRCSEDDITPEQIDADLEDQAARQIDNLESTGVCHVH